VRSIPLAVAKAFAVAPKKGAAVVFIRMHAVIVPPAIILVRPQLGENIGKTARAMRNFGLREMRLVAPRDGWPNPAAGPAASGADDVLAAARVFDSVEAAVGDLAHVFATTVRPREMPLSVVSPEEAGRRIRSSDARSGILFGAERSGLDNDAIALADTILTIPTDPAFSSLNLAQAVLICAYEWRRAGGDLPAETVHRDGPPASKSEYLGLFDQLENELDRRGYFASPARRPVQLRSLRSLLQNARLTSQEVRTLRGVFKGLAKPEREKTGCPEPKS